MIRPEDIQSKEFEIKMRGYDRDEVDDFLDAIIEDMSTLYEDNTELTKRVQRLSDEIAGLKAQSAEVQKSLELTKYQCEEMKKNARIEAKQIIDKANNDAASIMHSIENNKLRMKAICNEMLEHINKM